MNVTAKRVCRSTLSTLLLALLSMPLACVVHDVHDLVPATVDEDPLLPQIDIDVAGATRGLHVRTFGDDDNPPMLVLHGSLSDMRALLPLAEGLSDAYHVVAFDQRGNGLSERIPQDEYTFDSVVDEIDAVRRAFFDDDEPITMVGHSFGAMYATLYTSHHPERVDQLVLLEPGGLNADIFEQTYSDILRIDLLEDGQNQTYWQNETLTPTDHAALDHKGLLILDNHDQANYYCDGTTPPMPVWRPGVFVEYVRNDLMAADAGPGRLFGFDFSFGLDGFAGDTLLVGGACGALGFAFQARWHAPLFRNVELARVDDAGHRMMVEQPAQTLAITRGFLRHTQ